MIDKPVQYLKGVGPSKSKLLSRLGINTVRDLLSYFPRDYEDRRIVSKIAALAHNQKAVVMGKVELTEVVKLNFSLSVLKAAISDGTGIAYAHFYRKINPYHKHDIFAKLKKDFLRGATVLMSGQAEIHLGEKRFNPEEYEIVVPGPAESLNFGKIVPVYRATEGLSQKWLRKAVNSALENNLKDFWDVLPVAFKERGKLEDIETAVRQIHFPEEPQNTESARQRLALNEFLLLETALALSKTQNKKISKQYSYKINRNILTPFKNKLGFELTSSQKKVINEIFADMMNSKPMTRLLLGDVGSGKTVVAVSAMLLAAENRCQSALLSPTEILAEQHYLTLSRMTEGLPVNISLLTGKGKKKSEKLKTYGEIEDGKADIIIGTHAILEERVKFRNLSLIVIDEQHRFGVLQRAVLQRKSANPDVLVMTATPIPRTLALTLYGDLDVSIINELPPGRKPVETVFRDEPAAYDLIRKEISKSNQAFIVYPLVEESDKLELKAAVKEAENLAGSVFKNHRIGLLHGQMPAKDKEKVMMEFRSKAFDILIATTVIEVGIDIPDATVMVIEHSERFGLATLHQLRGRIGRGKEKSFCVLLGDPKTDEAKKRIQVMLSAQDGFTIAEEDLNLRGPGEFFGTAQHGVPEFRAGNMVKDLKIIEHARAIAGEIIKNDEKLKNADNSILRTEMLRIYSGRFGLPKIG
ncbi:MAG: ATP-dependent DNA helicase RecG [Elusimicrobiota bacterium]